MRDLVGFQVRRDMCTAGSQDHGLWSGNGFGLVSCAENIPRIYIVCVDTVLGWQ